MIPDESLDNQYRKYFNKTRDAHIKMIASEPDSGGVVVVYENGSEVLIGDVLTWVQLFEKLEKLHPR